MSLMKIAQNMDEKKEQSLRWLVGLSALVYYVFFAIYTYRLTQSLAAAIVSVIIAALVCLTLIGMWIVIRFFIIRLDPHDFRGEFSLYFRHFLRRKPDIRGWFASIIALPLVSLFIIDLFVELYTLEYITTYTFIKTFLIIFFFAALVFLIETKFPHRSGKIIPYEEVMILLDKDKMRLAKSHFEKSLKFFDNEIEPSYENCIKEAVCALEAYVETLTQKPASKNFSKVVKQLQGKGFREIPPSLAQGMIQVYSYRGDGQGVAHAALEGSKVSHLEAELVLNLVASYIFYLHSLYSQENVSDNS